MGVIAYLGPRTFEHAFEEQEPIVSLAPQAGMGLMRKRYTSKNLHGHSAARPLSPMLNFSNDFRTDAQPFLLQLPGKTR